MARCRLHTVCQVCVVRPVWYPVLDIGLVLHYKDGARFSSRVCLQIPVMYGPQLNIFLVQPEPRRWFTTGAARAGHCPILYVWCSVSTSQ